MSVEAISAARPAVHIGRNDTAPVLDQKHVKSLQGSGEQKADVSFLKDVLEVAEHHFHVSGVNLDFSVHEATGKVTVAVTDKETGEVVREIPPRQVLDLMARIDEMMGILYDQKI